MDVDACIQARRSVRAFKPEGVVPESDIRAVLTLASRAASSCNVQPWRLAVLQGEKCKALSLRLLEAFDAGEKVESDYIDPGYDGDYRRLQIECAVEFYGALGVARGDVEARRRVSRYNYEFFGAPQMMVLSVERRFKESGALDAGLFLGNLMLLFQSRGVSTCAQASLTHYAGILREELKIPESQLILCGLAFGYEDETASANRVRQKREPLERWVTFHQD
jgi:nitroreductase